MKKLLTLLLAAIITITGCVGVYADSTGLFRGIDILPELLERPDTDYVRRDEFSAVAAALMGFTTVEPSATPFADVAEDNIYGSSIRTVKEGKIMNGVSSYEFAPGSTITFQDAIVTYVRILGYQVWADSKGGYPGGYNQVATSLKLFNEVSRPLDSMLTFGDLWALTDWVLEAPTAEANYSMTDGVLTEEITVNKNALTLLEKNLGYTMYEAFVDEVTGETYSVNVTITADDERGNAKYGEGDTLTLKAATTVNIAAYDKAPVYIWISDSDELIHIAMQDNCEVIYGTVYSVNRDYTEGASYNTAKITEMAFWDIDKDYKADEDGIAFYKNDELVTGSISLTDKYVRAVIKDKKITAVETWDFKNGGIVSEINFKSIAYQRGDITEAITELENYTKKIFILDGEMRDIKDLKTGTLIDYYISPDKETLILLGSERRLSDTFEALTDEEIQVGNLVLKKADVVYTMTDGKGYKEGDVSELLSTKILAYVDAFGKVRYITTADTITRDNFIGYLLGVRQGTGLDSDKEVYLTNLDGPDFTKKVYKLSDNLVYEDGIDYAELESNKDTRTASSIYRFKVNSKDEIVRVSRLKPYYGYTANANGLVSVTLSGEIPSNGDPAYVTVDGKRLYFPLTEQMVALYEEDGEATFGTITYNDFIAKTTTNGITLSFFGEEMSSEFDLILAAGDISTLRGGSSSVYGIVNSVRTILAEDGETAKSVEIEGVRYVVSDEVAAGLKENTFVRFSKKSGGFSKDELIISDSAHLSGDMYSWAGFTGSGIGFNRDIITKIDSKRIFFEDGSVYFLNPSGCLYKIYNDGKFETGNSQDFLQGRDVIYVLNTSQQTVIAVFYMN